eukprot:gb/GFBE01038854.1/.p1 GENE.gb/GFBE01038854.1/~~gb/GFBE01038854.1/.p1  ORF type:complete len:474 (+),score=166.71 gb/GFBE01038854.1/:1-1422(+)
MADSSSKFGHSFCQKNDGKLSDFYNCEKKVMGEGSYGAVTKGIHRDTGAVRAVKAIDKSKISDDSRFRDEMNIQAALDHPNIVKLYEVFEDGRNYYLVMELCSGGELFDRIVEEAEKHDGSAFGEQDAATYMTQILGAMSYLHSHNFVHRDIKPENFLMQNKDQKAEIKVIDFGLAKNFNVGSSDVMKTKAGTPYYVAPEVLQGKYNEKCDIWSCGVICYILLCGYPPFYGDSDNEILKKVKSGKFDFPEEDWGSVSDVGKDFICKMLTKDPARRPSAAEMLEHPWIRTAEAARPEGKVGKDLCAKLRKFHGGSKMKKVALTLIATQLKDEDVNELRTSFLAMDANHDGTLTFDEVRAGISKTGLELTADFEQVMRELDTDGSGSIDYSEFIAATLDFKKYLRRDVMWGAFRTFDKDGSGKISKEELKEACKLNDDLSASLITEVDTDGDGEISFEEFVAMMERGETSKADGK